MSGSSNNDTPSFPSAAEQATDCSQLKIRTQLSSPDNAVLATLSGGDFLSISLASAQGPIQAITEGGSIAGAILSSKQAQLIKCISSGYEYQAEVLSIDGGNCQIFISAL